MFHVSMLRKYIPDPSHVIHLEELDIEEDLTFENLPIRIEDRREQVLRGKTIPLVRVLWRHRGVEESTWERESVMRLKYPSLFAD